MTGIDGVVVGKTVAGPALGQALKLAKHPRRVFLKVIKKEIKKTSRGNPWLSFAERNDLLRAYRTDETFQGALLRCTTGPSLEFLTCLRAILKRRRRSEGQISDYGLVIVRNFILYDPFPDRILMEQLGRLKDDTEAIKALVQNAQDAPLPAAGDIKSEEIYRGYLLAALEDRGAPQRIALTCETSSARGLASDLLPRLLGEWPMWAVVAPGGAGKTTELRALGRRVLQAGDEVIYLDLRKLDAEAKRQANDHRLDIDTLLKSEAVLLPTPLDVLLRLAQQSARRVVWIVDGVNELPLASGDAVLRLLRDHLFDTSAVASSVLVVSDRAGRRYEGDQGWKTVRLLEIDDLAVEKAVSAEFGSAAWTSLSNEQRQLMKLPFFLDLVLRGGALNSASSAAGAIASFIQNVVRLSPTELQGATRLALDIYERGGPLSASSEDVVALGQSALEKLLTSGTLRGVAGRVEFRHQLLLDYFAACGLAADPSLWQVRMFDAVSLQSNSLDSLLFVAEMLDDLELADQYLIDLHDWNWNATTKCLAALGRTHSNRISDGIVVALWAMVAAKQFDGVQRSADRAHERTAELDQIFAGRFTARFSEARSVAEVATMVRAEQLDHDSQGVWFKPWLETFAGTPAPTDLICRLYNSNPLISWAAANELRQRAIGEPEQEAIRRTYRAAAVDASQLGASVRWRAVHAIAESDSEATIEFLFQALKDPYSWVQYGAVRGLVELAAHAGATNRPRILAGLLAQLPTLAEEPANQLFWAAGHITADAEWLDAVRPVLQEACQIGSQERRQRLSERLAEFESWAAARPA